MKAAVFHGPNKSLSIEDVDEPRIGPSEILVRVAACGVCATDLHYLHGTPTFKKPPLILGHEVSGRVEEVGPDVVGLAKGDPVLVPAVIPCGACIPCRRGRDNLCERMAMLGNHIDGGFAEYVRVPARGVVPLTSDIPLPESAIISDAISTPFHAVKNRGGVRGGEWVAVFGCGGVGINAVQISAILGALVVAIDIDDRKLDLARQLGALEVVHGKGGDPVKTVRALTGGGADVALEVVGRPQVLEQAFGSVKPGGRLVSVGYSEEDWPFRVARAMFREITVLGSMGCPSAEYPSILRLVRAGKIRLNPVISSKLPLDQVNDALRRLQEGRAVGRQMIVF